MYCSDSSVILVSDAQCLIMIYFMCSLISFEKCDGLVLIKNNHESTWRRFFPMLFNEYMWSVLVYDLSSWSLHLVGLFCLITTQHAVVHAT